MRDNASWPECSRCPVGSYIKIVGETAGCSLCGEVVAWLPFPAIIFVSFLTVFALYEVSLDKHSAAITSGCIPSPRPCVVYYDFLDLEIWKGSVSAVSSNFLTSNGSLFSIFGALSDENISKTAKIVLKCVKTFQISSRNF